MINLNVWAVRLLSATIGVVLLAFVVILATRESGNGAASSSPLIGELVPAVTGESLNGTNFDIDEFSNRWALINFFASWCTPCKAEHHLFFEIKKEKPELFIFGISYKDNPNDSKKFLKEEGNPYSFVGIDQDGKIGFEFGVFGLPETFIINNKSQIIFKHTGPLTREIIDNEITKLF